MLRLRHALLLATALGGASGASAQIQMFSPDFGMTHMPMSNFLASSYLVQEVANGTLAAGRRPPGTAAAAAARQGQATPPQFVPAARPIAPGKLAGAYPEHVRAQAEQVFTQTLAGYRVLEGKAGLPRNDLAGAIAVFVLGNYSAYRDESVPDEQFSSLAQQIRGVISNLPELGRASNAQKQELYEQMAIVGTTMALTREGLRQQPDVQRTTALRQAAGNYLQQVLHVDPERLRLGAQGLSVK